MSSSWAASFGGECRSAAIAPGRRGVKRRRSTQAREPGPAAGPRARDAHAEHPPFRLQNERRYFMDGRRGERVDTHRPRLTFPLRVDGPVLEHVADRLEGLAGRLQEVGVVAVREHGPLPRHHLAAYARGLTRPRSAAVLASARNAMSANSS